MNKLEDDPTYNVLQEKLAIRRAMRQQNEEQIVSLIIHINAIKRDFKTYEEESNARWRNGLIRHLKW